MKTGIAYMGIRDADCTRQHMDSLVSRGYTHVCHPYSESDFLYYRETMREIIEVSKAAGLNVYVSPCGMGKVFNGKALSELAMAKDVQPQTDNHNEVVPAACPNSRDFQEYLRNWVEEICTTEVETIMWDNPHFYSTNGNEQWCCRCEICQKLFRKKTNHLMPNSLTQSVKEFRLSSIYELLSELTGLVRTKGKRNSVCLVPSGEDLDSNLWEAIAELPTVDEMAFKPYWETGEKPANISKSYHEFSKKLLNITKSKNKEAQIWIKNFSIQKNNEESVAEATYAAYNEGIRNIFAWAFKGTYNMSSFRSENPERVWKIQTDAFAECHDKAIMNEMIDTMRSTKS
jgi:hypothetical protein